MSSGKLKMEWAAQYMPVLAAIRKQFVKDKPFEGMTIGMALHVEAKTANLVSTLAAGGAEVHITGCNPLSTHDDVAEAHHLADLGALAHISQDLERPRVDALRQLGEHSRHIAQFCKGNGR